MVPNRSNVVRLASWLMAVVLVMVVMSCSTTKDNNLAYFKNLPDAVTGQLPATTPAQVRLQVDDEIAVTISSSAPEATAIFNAPLANSSVRGDVAVQGNPKLQSHIVDRDGNIEMPVLGKINVQGKTITEVEKYIDGEYADIPLAKDSEIGRTVDYVAGRNRYIGYLISLSKYSFNGKRVGLDVANGAAWSIAKGVFDALGAKTYVINNEPDGFNINTDCGSTHIEHLRKFVLDNHLDVGFAYDGDADRCLCVDEKGNIVTGDHILYIYGKYMKERGKLLNNTVVTTVMSNFGLYKALDKAGIGYAKTAVGDKYVYENMVQTGNRIGGEQSGHIIFSKYATTGDGILTSLKIMEVMLAKEKPLSELAAPVVFYPQVLKNVRVKSKPDAQNDPDVMEAVRLVGDKLGQDGRILVRESGTEPVIRVMVEADTDEICEKYVDSVIDVIGEKGHIVE